jgi:hypothetical protein
VGNRAWTEADGEVAIDTLLGSDPNTENGWDPSAYDPAQLTADGYLGQPLDSPLGFIGEARTRITGDAGATMTFECVKRRQHVRYEACHLAQLRCWQYQRLSDVLFGL